MAHQFQSQALNAPDLLRAARAALNWSLVEAGQNAGISVSAVLSAERKCRSLTSVPTEDLDALRRAYEDRGIRFFHAASGERGIQLAPS